MALTIGNENLNTAPLTVSINDILESTNVEDDLDQDKCHVYLDSKSGNLLCYMTIAFLQASAKLVRTIY